MVVWRKHISQRLSLLRKLFWLILFSWITNILFVLLENFWRLLFLTNLLMKQSLCFSLTFYIFLQLFWKFSNLTIYMLFLLQFIQRNEIVILFTKWFRSQLIMKISYRFRWLNKVLRQIIIFKFACCPHCVCKAVQYFMLHLSITHEMSYPFPNSSISLQKFYWIDVIGAYYFSNRIRPLFIWGRLTIILRMNFVDFPTGMKRLSWFGCRGPI